MAVLNTIIEYVPEEELYRVFDAANEQYLFAAGSRQVAWDTIKAQCERNDVTMGDIDYRGAGPDVTDGVEK